MPKVKTHSGAKKRFKITKKGNVKYFHANKAHILTKKSRKRKRYLRHVAQVDSTNKKAIQLLLPYAQKLYKINKRGVIYNGAYKRCSKYQKEKKKNN